MPKIDPNKKMPIHNPNAAKFQKARQAEEVNFTERINKAYRSETKTTKDGYKYEQIYDKKGNELYQKRQLKDGSTMYTMPDANEKGVTTFKDLDNDGNIDRMTHYKDKIRKDGCVYGDISTKDFWAVDKNDDGNFDMVTWKC